MKMFETNSWKSISVQVEEYFKEESISVNKEVVNRMLARWFFDVMGGNPLEGTGWWETLDNWLDSGGSQEKIANTFLTNLSTVLKVCISEYGKKQQIAAALQQMVSFFEKAGDCQNKVVAIRRNAVPEYFEFIQSMQHLIWAQLPIICFIGGHASGDMFGIGASALIKGDMGIVVYKYQDEGQDHSDSMAKFFISLIGKTRVKRASPITSESNRSKRQQLVAKQMWEDIFQLMNEMGKFCWLAPYNVGTYYLMNKFPKAGNSPRGTIRQGFQVEDSINPKIQQFVEKKTARLEELRKRRVLVLWSRFSGKKGEYHPEHDTSFKGMAQLAWTATMMGYYVIIVGDKPVMHNMVSDRAQREGRFDEICNAIKAYFEEPRCFNMTEFWTEKEWEAIGASRIAQFQVYELLHRWCDVRHLGMRSGNMEALALLGYFVRYMEEKGSWGGPRMAAWHGTTIGYERILLDKPPTRVGKYLQQDREARKVDNAYIPSYIKERNRGIANTSSQFEKPLEREFDTHLAKIKMTYRSRPPIENHEFGSRDKADVDVFVVDELAQRLLNVVKNYHQYVLEPMEKPLAVKSLESGFEIEDLRSIVQNFFNLKNPLTSTHIDLSLEHPQSINMHQIKLKEFPKHVSILEGVSQALLRGTPGSGSCIVGEENP